MIKIEEIFNFHANYCCNQLKEKRFTHAQMSPLIETLKSFKGFEVTKLGESIENRDINLVKFGNGKLKVFLWSQMHGDEPTATMCFFDIFNFFNSEDNFNQIRNFLLENITFYFIPMLNPDGAERINRRNAAGIDINRDFLRQSSPESQILKNLALNIKPDFGFNMHDQDYRWAAGDSNKLATISFLSPPFNAEKSINSHREKAIKLIASLNNQLQQFVPGNIARYYDDFEPRSFGDNFSNYFSTILIESGRHPGDINKHFTRKLNFAILIKAFIEIANQSYKSTSLDDYFKIETNGKFLYDIILRGVTQKVNNTLTKIDICINREEAYYKNERIPYLKSNIEDIGDCSNVQGINEVDCSDLFISPAKTESYNNISNITDEEILCFFKNGVLCLKVDEFEKSYISAPINVSTKENPNLSIEIGNSANFILTDKNDNIKYLVFNGLLIDAACKELPNLNGLKLG